MSRMKERAAQVGLFDAAETAPSAPTARAEVGGATTPPPDASTAPASVPRRRRRHRKCDVCRNKGIITAKKMIATIILDSGARYEREMPDWYVKDIVCPECEGDSLLPEDDA